MKKNLLFMVLAGTSFFGFSQFAPPAGEAGSTAIHNEASEIVGWASEVVSFERGLQSIANPEGPLAAHGEASAALGMAEGNSVDVVSLGDKGIITLTFPYAIRNGEGADFAVFENSFSDDYLELAHVEVSSDGEHFVRFPSVCNVQTEVQTGSFGTTDATLLYNLAGKYRQGYGTPFDLEEIADAEGIDVNNIVYVRIIDVVGSLDPAYGTVDSEGTLINDPFETAFESGGFDLDGIGVLHDNNPAAGLNEESAQLMVRVYPNPSNGTVYISNENNEDKWAVSIFGWDGKLVMKEWGNGAQPLALDLQSGTYLYQIQSGDKLAQGKLIVN